MPSKRHRNTLRARVSNGKPGGKSVQVAVAAPRDVPALQPITPATPDLNAELRRIERRVDRGRGLNNRDAQVLTLCLGLMRDQIDELAEIDDFEDLGDEPLDGPCVGCGGRGQADAGGRDEWANCPCCSGSGRVKSDA